jgi:ABC-type bacteriocin/lantibiotic exporter with double-glycine peptidase domain
MTYLFTYFIISIYRVIGFLALEQEDKGVGIRELDEFESLEFRHVKFKYHKSEVYTLNDVSFKLEKGDKLSIVGVNGAGKSTLIKLMLGTYRIESG